MRVAFIKRKSMSATPRAARLVGSGTAAGVPNTVDAVGARS